MRYANKIIFLLVLMLLSSSCNQNLFSAFADKSSDDAILFSAQQYLASGDWNDAIAEFQKLSADAQADPNNIVQYASAYTGRCGLNFVNFATQIQNLGPVHIMTMLMKNIQASSATNWGDCKTAETILKTIANASGVVSTQDGQFLMVFNSLAKIGAILNFRADTNKDGTPDALWNPCDAGTGPTDLPQAEVNEVVTGLALFYQNVQNLSYATSIVSQMQAICTNVAVQGTPADFCSQIDPTTVTATQRPLVRAIIVETTAGIGLSIINNDPLTIVGSGTCGN